MTRVLALARSCLWQPMLICSLAKTTCKVWNPRRLLKLRRMQLRRMTAKSCRHATSSVKLRVCHTHRTTKTKTTCRHWTRMSTKRTKKTSMTPSFLNHPKRTLINLLRCRIFKSRLVRILCRCSSVGMCFTFPVKCHELCLNSYFVPLVPCRITLDGTLWLVQVAR